VVVRFFLIATGHAGVANFQGGVGETQNFIAHIIIPVESGHALFHRAGAILEIVAHLVADDVLTVFDQRITLGIKFTIHRAEIDVLGGQLHGAEFQHAVVANIDGFFIHLENHRSTGVFHIFSTGQEIHSRSGGVVTGGGERVHGRGHQGIESVGGHARCFIRIKERRQANHSGERIGVGNDD